MSIPEADAVRAALRTEMNPNHLFGFAGALSPDHCIAACLLHARASALEGRRALGTQLPGLLDTIIVLAERSEYTTPSTVDPRLLLRRRIELETLARRLRVPPAVLYRKTRQTACELVLDDRALFPDVHQTILGLARPLVLTIGPVRVLDPAAVRTSLPPTAGLSSLTERDERARWVRHYAREVRLAMHST